MRENLITYIKSLQDKKLPFFVFRKAGQSTVRVYHQSLKSTIKTPHDKTTIVRFSKFYKDDNQQYIIADVIKKFNIDSYKITTAVQEDFSHKDDEVTATNYKKLVTRAVNNCRSTGMKKVVLSRPIVVAISEEDTTILERLLDTYSNANCYYVEHPTIGKWMGATPEILAVYNGQNFKTMSLAGTQKFIENSDPISWGEKELEEQQIVTNHIINSLKITGADNINSSQVKTTRAGNLLHLKTDIEATVSKSNLKHTVEALNPTPAVCGLPVEKAAQFIKENEDYDRSYYTGYIEINTPYINRVEYYVNLRCMQLVDKTAVIYVGGGVTAQSDPAAEYQETCDKAATMGCLL